jgi:uncharacterized protein involved in cysteine biosynthesis
MIESLICLILMIVARVTVGSLSETFNFLADWVQWINIGIYVFAGLTVLMIIIKIIKIIKK